MSGETLCTMFYTCLSIVSDGMPCARETVWRRTSLFCWAKKFPIIWMLSATRRPKAASICLSTSTWSLLRKIFNYLRYNLSALRVIHICARRHTFGNIFSIYWFSSFIFDWCSLSKEQRRQFDKGWGWPYKYDILPIVSNHQNFIIIPKFTIFMFWKIYLLYT